MTNKYHLILITLIAFGSSTALHAKNYPLNTSECVYTETQNEMLSLYLGNCNQKNFLIDEIEVPNDTPKVNFIYEEIIQNKKYIVLSVTYSENFRDIQNRFNYSDDYYITNVYECNNECKLNLRLTNYFGSGGDMMDLNTDNIVYRFPYKTVGAVNAEIKSLKFNKWFNKELESGKVVHTTFINNANTFTPDHLGYLIQGDKFIIKNISSNWLYITYTNNKDTTTTGWIDCNDTDVCK